ncbi:3,5-dihydroxyphenylacetyl-CoA synthase DpgA [Methylobacter sp. Wu1]|uniref:3,5-dihydroxyphenylacetyl-CoA synthase DpgA n=1 Tax=Methylobacter sp. Wu1 TaxID=3119359 RepID=UPI002F95D265
MLANSAPYPRVIGLGTANPDTCYDQTVIADMFGHKQARIKKLFENSHIRKRFLYLPEPGEDGLIEQEDSATLQKKHLSGSLEMGAAAINKCLREQNLTTRDIDYLACVTSTGFLCPGVSAHIAKALDFRPDVRRTDILGMGCSAGVNGLQVVTDYVRTNPGKKALLLAIEVCSSAYYVDSSMETAVVNSLFGDGSAALLITSDDEYSGESGPMVVDFESETITENIDALRYNLVNGMLSFYLDKDIPYVIGANIHKPIQRLLERNDLKLRNIDHWIIHSGGKKVIDSIKYNIDISNHDVRHTLSVLQDYGNMSSCSFLFSYDNLRKENIAKKGDIGVVVAMGPGVAIETALLRW